MATDDATNVCEDCGADTDYFMRATAGLSIVNRITGVRVLPTDLLRDWNDRAKPIRFFTDQLVTNSFHDLHVLGD